MRSALLVEVGGSKQAFIPFQRCALVRWRGHRAPRDTLARHAVSRAPCDASCSTTCSSSTRRTFDVSSSSSHASITERARIRLSPISNPFPDRPSSKAASPRLPYSAGCIMTTAALPDLKRGESSHQGFERRFACPRPASATPGLLGDSLARRPVGGSPVRAIRSPGSVRGAGPKGPSLPEPAM
jgi:hypothetical protein